MNELELQLNGGKRTLCHLSCSSLCAASDPDPIAFASYRTDVPEGSVWNLQKVGIN